MTNPSDIPSVGFSDPVLANTSSQAMVRAFAYVAGQEGFRVLATDAALDLSRQQSDIVRLVDMGVQAMLVYPVGDPRALWEALDYAAERDVKIFGHDDIGHPAIVSSWVTPVAEMGALGASLLADRLGGVGDVVIVGGVPAPAILDRNQGFRDQLEKHHPGLRVVAELENLTDVEAGAEAVVADLLASGVAFDGLFGYNDSTAIGAATAARAYGKSVAIVGNNGEPHGIEAVASGTIAATVDRCVVELAVRGGKVMFDLLKGRVPVSDLPAEVAVEVVPITPEELASFVPWDERCPEPAPGTLVVV